MPHLIFLSRSFIYSTSFLTILGEPSIFDQIFSCILQVVAFFSIIAVTFVETKNISIYLS